MYIFFGETNASLSLSLSPSLPPPLSPSPLSASRLSLSLSLSPCLSLSPLSLCPSPSLSVSTSLPPSLPMILVCLPAAQRELTTTHSSRTYKQNVLLGKSRIISSRCSPTNGDNATPCIVVFKYTISKTPTLLYCF